MEIRKLNSLRALAAGIVLITHFSDETGWLDTSLGGRAGQYGVMLFFLLSGFLMAHLYLSKAFSRHTVIHYALARIGRVIPLYLLLVFASFILSSNGFNHLFDIPDSNHLLSHLLFIYGDSVLWTIAPEIHFYLLFVGFWAIAAWRPGYVLIAALAAIIALFFFNFPRPHGNISGLPFDFHIFRSLPWFLIGMLLGMLYGKVTVPKYMQSSFFVAALLLIPLLYPDFTPVTSDAKRRMWLNYEVLIVTASVFACIVFLVPNSSKILANRVGDFLGKISYSLYLLHMPILPLIAQLSLAIELKLLLFIALSLCAATVSFYCVEKPISQWFRQRKSGSSQQLIAEPDSDNSSESTHGQCANNNIVNNN